MPRDAYLTSIYGTFRNLSAITPVANSQVTPYVAIAIAEPDSNTFQIIEQSITSSSESLIGGTTYPANTLLTGNTNNISYFIPAGYKVAIVNGMNITGTNPYAAGYYFYYNGGLTLY